MKTMFWMVSLLILGWGILGTGCWHRSSTPNQRAERTSTLYTCSMHPQIRREQPGKCPICGMPLLPISADPAQAQPRNPRDTANAESVPAMNKGDAMPMIVLDARQEMLAGVHTTIARAGSLSHTFWLTGTTIFDPQRVETLSAWFSGWITRLLVNNPGQYVHSGQALYEIYSPDLLADEQTYLTVYRQWQRGMITDSSLLMSLRQRLLRWGLSPRQIEDLPSHVSTGKLTVYSRGAGYLTRKYVQEGDHVSEGQPVMQLNRTAILWVQAQLDPEQIDWLSHLKSLHIQLPAHPGHVFDGRIAFSNPVVQPGSQVYLVQIAFSAGSVPVQPGEMAEVELETDQPIAGALRIPATAVVYASGQPVVWVETKPHTYMMRHVRLGAVNTREAIVVSGLKPGERVVDQGSYLLHSQYSLTYGAGVNMSGMQMSDMKMEGKGSSM
ncbi:efflux RND transporter periplasmic adaptor subunit [Thermoflavifilum thermophilum]|uniref:Membrane fusion protein, Cu(I)/Ag(I) efflux system n=1 Tax=Thermoflavifilum thermophilum TaxID=1393122 RepID=A0A1I7ND29_9BACT|nr:efflux RND transporter periplasmic adaptor subunit [Thermoflavifilum thermophilum]SFV32562.1 membrane fusion protein, Cu(I)/Ag(I) efflux system [Thermoflavifilum thermophilum]